MRSRKTVFLLFFGRWAQRRPRVVPRTPPGALQGQILFFVTLIGTARRQPHHARCERSVRRVTRPRKFTCRSALTARVRQLLQGAPGSHSQDTATGFTHTWPPASAEWTTHNSEDLCSCTLGQEQPLPRRDSQRLCRRPAHPALWVFCTPTQ